MFKIFPNIKTKNLVFITIFQNSYFLNINIRGDFLYKTQ